MVYNPPLRSSFFHHHPTVIPHPLTGPNITSKSNSISDIVDLFPVDMDLDYTQEWSDLQESMKKPKMTADEEKKHKERKARELKIMLERAEAALEGNRKVFGKPPVKKSWSANIEKSDWFFRR